MSRSPTMKASLFSEILTCLFPQSNVLRSLVQPVPQDIVGWPYRTFYDANEGRVLIDGIDVRDLKTEDLRKLVMVVPQTPYCFHGTIAENLTLFDPSITDAELREAAEIACAAPFIEALPGTYDFKLLSGGANLSHGQRQLLALARALLYSSDSILVLDEATSNIDTETELLIQRGLNRVPQGRTSIVIAHRLSKSGTAIASPVMRRGQIVEGGTHDELFGARWPLH
ncbi:MAG: ATP-binding cassette domain-containing protein [Chloroflexi bacterium]|nr:ATP-binding cassette domain-containing protein [Chloroflexota bacterium]